MLCMRPQYGLSGELRPLQPGFRLFGRLWFLTWLIVLRVFSWGVVIGEGRQECLMARRSEGRLRPPLRRKRRSSGGGGPSIRQIAKDLTQIWSARRAARVADRPVSARTCLWLVLTCEEGLRCPAHSEQADGLMARLALDHVREGMRRRVYVPCARARATVLPISRLRTGSR
jgi:hypothetical protein